MYLSNFDQIMIRDMLYLSDELNSTALGLPNTLIFLQSIIDGSNCYVSMSAILSLFKRSHPYELNVSKEADVLFYQPNVQEKRRVVLERYFELAFKTLEQDGGNAYKRVFSNVRDDLISSLYDIYPALRVACSDADFEHMSESELLSLLSELGCRVEVALNGVLKRGYLLAVLNSLVISFRRAIGDFVSSCITRIRDYWRKFEVYSFEYRHFIRSYALKILLLIELKKCIKQKMSHGVREASVVQRPVDMFSGRVVRFSRARVLMLLTQLDSVFSQNIKPAKLLSYIDLVKGNGDLIYSIIGQNVSLERVINSAWNHLMPVPKIPVKKSNILSFKTLSS
jgi:hypothetical protein